MTLIISKVFTYDTDAGDYIQRVEGASGDNQVLEPAVRQAINNFVLGCKQDGIWNAIKASCILAGARTLNGALQPLVGPAPENIGHDSTHYNRKNGLSGSGATRYVNTKFAYTASNQDNAHFCVNAHTVDSNTLIASEQNSIIQTSAIRITSATATGVSGGAAGFWGASRSTSSEARARVNKTTIAYSSTSTAAQIAIEFFLFRRNSITPVSGSHVLNFYSIGESLNLALLDARVTDLINAFAAAIP